MRAAALRRARGILLQWEKGLATSPLLEQLLGGWTGRMASSGWANLANLPAALAALGEVGRAEWRRPGGAVGVPNDLTLASFSPLQAPSPECFAF
jgi:hypothetical protein